MTDADLKAMRRFREYVAPPDEQARQRARAAVAACASSARAGGRRITAGKGRPVRRWALAAAIACALAALLMGPVAGLRTTDRGPTVALPGAEPASAAELQRKAVAALEAARGVLVSRSRIVRDDETIETSEHWADLDQPHSFRTKAVRPGADGSESVQDAGQVLQSADTLLLRRIIAGGCVELELHAADGFGKARDALEQLEDDIEAFDFEVVPPREGDDAALLHLRALASDGRSDLWLDAASHLPVRLDEVSRVGRRGAGTDEQRSTTRFELVERSAAELLPPVPAGAECPRSSRNLG